MFIVYQTTGTENQSTGLISRTGNVHQSIPAPFDIYGTTRYLGDGDEKKATTKYAQLSNVNSSIIGTPYDINNKREDYKFKLMQVSSCIVSEI
jgi:hypothetical protein